MKILWMSNGRYSPSGYGNQTNLFVPELKRAGHDMTIFAYYGQEGIATRDKDGILTLPRVNDDYGVDIINAHMDYTGAELLITLLDPFALNAGIYGALNWCAWAPIDSAPALPQNVDALQYAKYVWAMSRFGEKQLKDAGIDCTYVPHGVNIEVFKPIDRQAARERFGKFIGADLDGKFLIIMNSANKGMPSRKGFSEALEAFKLFSDDMPNALLYIHTEKEGRFMGEPLEQTIAVLGIDRSKVLFPSQYKLLMGMLGGDCLNDMYNAGDVFLQTSHGEGFGIPIVEAQAAGCPVIVTDFSAMSELCLSGWKIPGQLFMHIPGTKQCIPDVKQVAWALRDCEYLQREAAPVYEDKRRLARLLALDYDYRLVANRYMLPAIEKMEDDLDQKKVNEAIRVEQRARCRAEAADAAKV